MYVVNKELTIMNVKKIIYFTIGFLSVSFILGITTAILLKTDDYELFAEVWGIIYLLIYLLFPFIYRGKIAEKIPNKYVMFFILYLIVFTMFFLFL